jgi:SAM-dependent methyltransferase
MVDDADSTPSQADVWRSEGGRRWASLADRLEAQIEPVTHVLLEFAALVPGERVLDVGCGRGVTTRAAASAVTPGGSVTGLDVSPELVAEARRASASGAPIEWIVGDAQVALLPAASFDVVISRFGVMFFDDAFAAFVNMRRATRPGGRLAMVVWQTRDRSEVLQHMLDVAVTALNEIGYRVEVDPPDQGPFAFGRSDYVHEVLETAGWHEVRIEHRELQMNLCGPGTLDQIVETGLAVGQLRAALQDAPAEAVATARRAIALDLEPRHDGTGVRMSGAISIVTGTNG